MPVDRDEVRDGDEGSCEHSDSPSDEARRKQALRRFSDNPFRPPNLTPEQLAVIEERNRQAREIYRQNAERARQEKSSKRDANTTK